MRTKHSSAQSYYGGYALPRRRRSKTDWAGVSLARAFDRHHDYCIRLQAQRLFYREAKILQVAVARMTGAAVDAGFVPKVRPQIAPCYTSYPAYPAALAAIGLTGFLEFRARVSERVLVSRLSAFLENPAEHDGVNVDPETYRRFARMVADCVETRLLIEDLARMPSALSVEVFRLFSASQQSLRFVSLAEMLRVVILYGDILPDGKTGELHPATGFLLDEIVETSLPFMERLPVTPSDALLGVGEEWVRILCLRLSRHLPEPVDGESLPKRRHPEADVGRDFKFGGGGRGISTSDEIGPLHGPHPPLLFDPPDAAGQVGWHIGGTFSSKPSKKSAEERPQGPGGDPAERMLADFIQTVTEAAGRQPAWEDIRSDLVEQAMRISGFGEGPIQGSPMDGHTVTARLGKDLDASGEIFDQPVELSDDLPACEELMAASRPLADALRRAIYPNIAHVPRTQRFLTSGILDPSRLAFAEFSSAIFKRYQVHQDLDSRGRPVLLMVCDGSGSLGRTEMRMLKMLAAAWLESTVKSDIQVLAGLYNTGAVRQGVAGPLVRWIYHPQKTAAIGRRDAVRAVASLPDTGDGGQADALSLAFMVSEAFRMARGRMVYLIVISDCQWCRSFRTEKTAKEEVYGYFEKMYEDFPGRLHTTLVGLGVTGDTGLEGLLDKVIAVSHAELSDCLAVARRIGVYVASCMKERRRLVSGT